MGILENIESKLDRVIELLEGDDLVTETTLPNIMKDAATADPVGFSQAVEQAKTSPSVEVDKNGIPWDERIHASTKTQTDKGVWKKKRGVNDKLFNEVVAELKQNKNSDKQVQSASENVAKFPPVGDAPTAPDVPNVPSVPPVPGAPVANDNFKKLAIKAVNEIAEKHGVEYSMLDEVFAQFNTKDFTLMKPEHYERFHAIVDEYACDLNDTSDLVKSIVEIAGQETFDKYIAENFNVREYSQVPRTQLRVLIDALTPWNQQLVDWKAAQAAS
ncbi:hypothetical protein [Pseudoalteromonas luteoviolacea]|uniref:hypothetical protein n=1 Tax=Pseudoalteromonas luteoviolacea TaxID=43657 RepID=UPI001B385D81|nr:hypothetical protein [Pseudoalteromonas luteoviolacea]MBQ4838810.1 hypothetical protein [Pseudoalteromonas luteoviolacea]